MSFDGRNKKWSLDSEYQIKNKRIDNYELYEIQKDKWEFGKSLSFINVNQRIGMESTMGEVYKVSLNEYNDFFIAAKILPIINSGSYINNEKELAKMD